jgi:cytochrome d ubiquinol oxidase subunit I
MDVLMLSRIQFAVTAGFHFLFVPMTLGVIVLCALMQTFYYKTGDDGWYKLVKFFQKLFIINFVVGIITGISLEFQFGMNWAEYAKYVGDVFGVPLAIEATLAFFLESVFFGLWVFGENRVSKKVHLISVWLVAFGSTISALWILFANAFMQRPVGYVINNGRVELNDFFAFMANPYGWIKFFHTSSAGYLVGSFFVIAVSAYQIMKNRDMLFKRSFKLASYLGLLSSLAVLLFGHFHVIDIFKYQPTKFAAMESVWDGGKEMPYSLIVIPDERNEKNYIESVKIPYLLSFMSGFSKETEIKGLKSFDKNDRPPVTITFFSFKIMFLLGMLFIAFLLLLSYLSYSDRVDKYPVILKTSIFITPLTYIACQLGWMLSEVGRQPWSVYGLLRTADSYSKNLSLSSVIFSLSAYSILYAAIGITAFYLMFKYAKQDIKGV